MIIFDVKQSAEPTTQPHIRIAPLRGAALEDAGPWGDGCEVRGCWKPAKNLLLGDLYLMPDGGRGIKSKFRNF